MIMNIKDGDTVNLPSAEIRNGSNIQSSESTLSTLQENRGPLTTNLPFLTNESPTPTTHNIRLIYKENQLSSTSKQVTMMTSVLSSSNVTADGVSEISKLKSLKNLVPLNPVTKASTHKRKSEISAILRGISEKFMKESCGPVDSSENGQTGNIIDISDPSTTIIPTNSNSNCDINLINDTDENNVSTPLQTTSFINKSILSVPSVQNNLSNPVLQNSNFSKVGEVPSDTNHSHKIDDKNPSDNRLKEDGLREPLNKLPIPIGTVIKKPVDIMMHKDKINILRQMSQIFNEEQPHEATVSSESDEEDGHTLSEDMLNSVPRIETATLQEVACSTSQISETTSISESTKINNKVDSQHLIEENGPIIQPNDKDSSPERSKDDDTRIISIPPPPIQDEESNLKTSTKAHHDLSSESNSSSSPNSDDEYDTEEGEKKVYYVPTEIRHDEPISVQSYIGENGQSVDVIDGFTFMSYDNEDAAVNDTNSKKKSTRKKQRGKKKIKSKRISARNKVSTKSTSSELGLVKTASEDVNDAISIDSFDELPSVDVSDASDYHSFPTTPVPNEEEQNKAKDSDEGTCEPISHKETISPKNRTVIAQISGEKENLPSDNHPERTDDEQRKNLEVDLTSENSVNEEENLHINNCENENINDVSRPIDERIVQIENIETEANKRDVNDKEEESNHQVEENELNQPPKKHVEPVSEHGKQSPIKSVPKMSPAFASSDLDEYLSNRSTLNISYEVPKCKRTEAGVSNIDDDVFIKPSQRSTIRHLSSSSNGGNTNNNARTDVRTSSDSVPSTSFELDHSDIIPAYDEISVDSILYPKEKYKYYYPDYNKECNSFGSSGEKSSRKPDVFVCRAGRLVPLSSVVKRNNTVESEREKVELTYIYDEGKLLLLCGSMVKVDPSKTVPVHAMVVVPKKNGLKKLGIGGSLKDDFKSVYIDEKLANFALTALRKLHEIPQTSFRKFKGGFGKKSKPGYRYPHLPSNSSIVDKVSAKLDILPSSTIQQNSQRKKLDNIGISSSTASKGKILNYKNSNLYKKNMNRFPSLFREMKRLNMNFVDYEDMRKDDNGSSAGGGNLSESVSDSDNSTPCDKQCCILGCVCSSLKCRPRAMIHCGKASCMFECECRHMNWSSTGGSNKANSRPIASLLNINRQQQQGLALKEKDFKWTIVNAGDGEVIMCGADKKRERKVPDRYRDTLYNSSLLDDGEFSYSEAVMESEGERQVRCTSPPHPLEMERAGIISSSLAHKHTKPCRVEVPWFSLPGMSVWCLVHNCYQCNCFKEPQSEERIPSPKGVKSMKQTDNNIIHYDTLKRSEDAWNDVMARIKEDIEKKGVGSLILNPKETDNGKAQKEIDNECTSIVSPRIENTVNSKEPPPQQSLLTNPEKIVDVLAECVILEVCVWNNSKSKNNISPTIHTLIKHWSHSNSHSARTAGYNKTDTCYRLIKDPLQQGFGYTRPISDCISNATICNVKNACVERYMSTVKNRDGSNKFEAEKSNVVYCANRGIPIVEIVIPPVTTPAVKEMPALPKIPQIRTVSTSQSLKRTITVESCENGTKRIKLAPIKENSNIEVAKVNNSETTVVQKRLSKISLVKSPASSLEPKQPVKSSNVASDEVKHTRHSLLNQPNTLTEMIQEEEKRGELELDMSDTTPGGCLLVAEARFRKLINMNIIGVIGLNKVCRCIIAPVESSEMLAQMHKIQAMISNRSLDVGPNMREIFFPPHQPSGSAIKTRFVLIKCNKLQQWEIVGLVQKSDGKTSASPIKTSFNISNTSVVKTNISNYVTSPTITLSKSKDNINILKSPNHIIVRAEEAVEKQQEPVLQTSTPVNNLNRSSGLKVGNGEDSVAESSPRTTDDTTTINASPSEISLDSSSAVKPVSTPVSSRKVFTYRIGDSKNIHSPNVTSNPLSFSVSPLQSPRLKSPPPRIIKASDGRFLLVRSQTPGLRLARAPFNLKVRSPPPSKAPVPLVKVTEGSIPSPIAKPLIVNEGAKPMKVVLLPSGSEPNKYFVVPSDSITGKKSGPMLSAPILKKTINLQALHSPSSSNSLIVPQKSSQIEEHVSSNTDTNIITVPSSLPTASTAASTATVTTNSDNSTNSISNTVESTPHVAVSGTSESTADESIQSSLDNINYISDSHTSENVPLSSDNTEIIIPSFQSMNAQSTCAALPNLSTNSISPIRVSTFSTSTKQSTNCVSLKLKTISISQSSFPICSEFVENTLTNSPHSVADASDISSSSPNISEDSALVSSKSDSNSASTTSTEVSSSSSYLNIPQIKRATIPSTNCSSKSKTIMDVPASISSQSFNINFNENDNSQNKNTDIIAVNGESECVETVNLLDKNSDEPTKKDSINEKNKSSLNKDVCNNDPQATNIDNQNIQKEYAKEAVADHPSQNNSEVNMITINELWNKVKQNNSWTVVDMSITFKSLKLSWLSGTIKKSILDRIFIMSQKDEEVVLFRVNNSKVNNASLYGFARPATAKNSDLLILASDADIVQDVSHLSLEAMFSNGRVKYFIELQKGEMACYYYINHQYLSRLVPKKKLPNDGSVGEKIPVSQFRAKKDLITPITALSQDDSTVETVESTCSCMKSGDFICMGHSTNESASIDEEPVKKTYQENVDAIKNVRKETDGDLITEERTINVNNSTSVINVNTCNSIVQPSFELAPRRMFSRTSTDDSVSSSLVLNIQSPLIIRNNPLDFSSISSYVNENLSSLKSSTLTLSTPITKFQASLAPSIASSSSSNIPEDMSDNSFHLQLSSDSVTEDESPKESFRNSQKFSTDVTSYVQSEKSPEESENAEAVDYTVENQSQCSSSSKSSFYEKSDKGVKRKRSGFDRPCPASKKKLISSIEYDASFLNKDDSSHSSQVLESSLDILTESSVIGDAGTSTGTSDAEEHTSYHCESENELVVDDSLNSKSDDSLTRTGEATDTPPSTSKGKASGLKTHGSMFYGVMRYHKSKGKKNAQKKRKMHSLSGDSDGSLCEKLSSKKRKKSLDKKDSSNESEADETGLLSSESVYDSCSTNDADSTNKFGETQHVSERHSNSVHNQMERQRRKEIGELFSVLQSKLRDFPEAQALDCRRVVWPKRTTLEHAMKYISSLTSKTEKLEAKHKKLLTKQEKKVKILIEHLQRTDVPVAEKARIQEMLCGIVYPNSAKTLDSSAVSSFVSYQGSESDDAFIDVEGYDSSCSNTSTMSVPILQMMDSDASNIINKNIITKPKLRSRSNSVPLDTGLPTKKSPKTTESTKKKRTKKRKGASEGHCSSKSVSVGVQSKSSTSSYSNSSATGMRNTQLDASATDADSPSTSKTPPSETPTLSYSMLSPNLLPYLCKNKQFNELLAKSSCKGVEENDTL